MNIPIEWLLEGEPWIIYRTRLDLLKQTEDDPQVQESRLALLQSQAMRNLLRELEGWPGSVLASHKSSGQLYHKLAFVADLGFKANDPGMERVIPLITAHRSPEGPFQIHMNIPAHFGGTGKDQWAWALCDAPIILYALVKFGLGIEPTVRRAIDYLASFARENGWPCVVAKELGSFRGPGRKDDPCPYATLIMLKLLSESEEWRDSPATRSGAETILSLWAESRTRHPYIFYMGTDFRKLKVPFIWYDLVHVLDVLSQFPWLRNDPRLLDMLALLTSKADTQGRFIPESVWTAWKDWEFSQKNHPSRWLTLMAWRIIEKLKERKLGKPMRSQNMD